MTWIPVSERLPEPFTHVLVTVFDRASHCHNYVVEVYFLAIDKWLRDGEYVDVLAWMPLPEPYKSDSVVNVPIVGGD